MADQKINWGVGVADPNDPTSWLKPNLDNAQAITKSNSTVYDPPLLALYIGGAGAVAVRMSGGGQSVTLTGLPQGALIPISVDQVLSTGTDATSIVGFW